MVFDACIYGALQTRRDNVPEGIQKGIRFSGSRDTISQPCSVERNFYQCTLQYALSGIHPCCVVGGSVDDGPDFPLSTVVAGRTWGLHDASQPGAVRIGEGSL